MENLQIFSIVLCLSGLFGLGMVEGLTEGGNITVTCTNESNSENQIQLLCNLEIFTCSSMDVSQEKFTIDQSSIQLPGIVFKARGEGAPNSLLASYSCQSEDWVNMSTVFSTVQDPNTTTVPVSHPGTISWHKSSNKQPTKPKEELESHLPKENKKDKNPNGRGGKKNKGKCEGGDGEGGKSEDGNSQDEAEEGNGEGGKSEEGNSRDEAEEGHGEGGKSEDGNSRDEAEEGNREGGKSEEGKSRSAAEEGDGKDSDNRLNEGYKRLYTAITAFAVIAALTVILLLLAAFCLHQWKKRIEQSTLKAGGTSAQKLQEGDEKVVTGNAEATNSGNTVIPPVNNPTGHIYQEIEETPQNSAEVKNNPLYVPSQEQQLGSQGQPPSNKQYSLLQLPV